jgi:hypothetical protein
VNCIKNIAIFVAISSVIEFFQNVEVKVTLINYGNGCKDHIYGWVKIGAKGYKCG